jgi:hypothetical protein
MVHRYRELETERVQGVDGKGRPRRTEGELELEFCQRKKVLLRQRREEVESAASIYAHAQRLRNYE